MPTNFSQEQRDALFNKFYEQGDGLLSSLGYKKMKIVDIANAVGIGTGTFYNFFKSKDEYILWLIGKRKAEAIAKFNMLADEYDNQIPLFALEQYLYDMVSNYNIYRYLNQEEYNFLQDKYGLLDRRDEKIAENAIMMMSKLDTDKSIDSFKVFSEAYSIVVIGTSDLSKLNENYLDEAIRNLVNAAASILY